MSQHGCSLPAGLCPRTGSAFFFSGLCLLLFFFLSFFLAPIFFFSFPEHHKRRPRSFVVVSHAQCLASPRLATAVRCPPRYGSSTRACASWIASVVAPQHGRDSLGKLFFAGRILVLLDLLFFLGCCDYRVPDHLHAKLANAEAPWIGLYGPPLLCRVTLWKAAIGRWIAPGAPSALPVCCLVCLVHRAASRQFFFFPFPLVSLFLRHAHVAHAPRRFVPHRHEPAFAASPLCCVTPSLGHMCTALAALHLAPCTHASAQTHAPAPKPSFFFGERIHTQQTQFFFFWGRSAMRYIFSHTTAALFLPLCSQPTRHEL